uniref:Uncharacterized protein n=1 Tax=Vespula pensylvanica TaxID=30213 RepID=A0A834PEY8_VESPE|nr:hypothetical protein H0235_000974 [Vespula pensylvanica]
MKTNAEILDGGDDGSNLEVFPGQSRRRRYRVFKWSVRPTPITTSTPKHPRYPCLMPEGLTSVYLTAFDTGNKRLLHIGICLMEDVLKTIAIVEYFLLNNTNQDERINQDEATIQRSSVEV